MILHQREHTLMSINNRVYIVLILFVLVVEYINEGLF